MAIGAQDDALLDLGEDVSFVAHSHQSRYDHLLVVSVSMVKIQSGWVVLTATRAREL